MVDSAVNDPHPCFDLPRREYCPVSHLPPAFRFYFSINFSFFPSKNKFSYKKKEPYALSAMGYSQTQFF